MYIRVWEEEFSVCKISKGSKTTRIYIRRALNSLLLNQGGL